MTELITITGTFHDPDGTAVSGVQIEATIISNTDKTFRQRASRVLTTSSGDYELALYPGTYRVKAVFPAERKTLVLGDIFLEEGSPDGTLNDYLMFSDPQVVNPVIYSELKRFYERSGRAATDTENNVEEVRVATKEATGAAGAAAEYAVNARQEREQAQTAASGAAVMADVASESAVVTVTARGEALLAKEAALAAADAAAAAALQIGLVADIQTGLKQTNSGQSFAVAQPVGSLSAVIIYLNDDGRAVRMAEISSSQTISNLSEKLSSGPDGSFIVRSENGPVMVIDSEATAKFVEIKSDYGYQLDSGNIESDFSHLPFTVRNGSDIVIALTHEGTLAVPEISAEQGVAVGGAGMTPDNVLPFSLRGKNGFVLIVDEEGTLRTPQIITDRVMIAGAEVKTDVAERDKPTRFPYVENQENIVPSPFLPADVYTTPSGEVMPVFPDMTKISGWGSSSLVQGGMPSILHEMAAGFGAEYYHGGQGGETSFQVSARLGSVPFTLIFPDNIIPASGSVIVTTAELPSNYRQNFLRPFTGAVAGVSGRLHWSGGLRFERSVPGSAVPVSKEGERFIPEDGPQWRTGVGLFWMYKNDTFYSSSVNPEVTPDATFQNLSRSFNYFSSFVKRVLVLGVFNDSNQVEPQLSRNRFLNELARRKFGRLYLDVQAYLMSQQVWTDTGIVPTAQDLQQQAAGLKPTSLSGDLLHLNEKAARAVAFNLIRPRMIDLGWYRG